MELSRRTEAVLRLHLTHRVGAVTYRKLVRAFGSPEGALGAPAKRLAEIDGIGPNLAQSIVRSAEESDPAVRGELELAEKHGVELVTIEDEAYPRALRTIFDPPIVLYVKGSISPRDSFAVAVVGTRRATYYGVNQAERLAGKLAAHGFTVISGLARGIDSAAHRGALSAGGRSFAVLGNGLSKIYPAENKELAEEMVRSGAVISELPMEVEPARENFPRRNRIISGLSLGVVVVEGGHTSGALITARSALEQGREVFAVPGKIDSYLSRGPHGLIKQGAKLVEDVEDILSELGPAPDELFAPGEADGKKNHEAMAEGHKAGEHREAANEAKPKALPEPQGLSPAEKKVFEALEDEPRDIDDIMSETELAPAEVSAALLVLELKRLCKQLPGKRFARLRARPRPARSQE